jgi:DNA-binding MarR family transcriptional regulator
LTQIDPNASAEAAETVESAFPGHAAPGHSSLWLFELAPRIVRLQDMLMREIDPPMTFGQFRLLQRVAEGRTTLTAISKASTLATPTLSERIESTVRKGLLKRKSVPGDRRTSLLILTPLGISCMEQAQARLEELSKWMLQGFDPERCDTFRSYGVELDAKLIVLLRKLLEPGGSILDAVSTPFDVLVPVD